jgi:hypothetical protein
MQDFHLLTQLLSWSSWAVLVLVTIILVSMVGKESTAECGLSKVQAPIRPCTRCGHRSLGNLGRPPSRLPTHKLTQRAGSGIHWGAGERGAHAGHGCRANCHGNSPGIQQEEVTLSHISSVSSMHFHPTVPPWEGKNKDHAWHTQ